MTVTESRPNVSAAQTPDGGQGPKRRGSPVLYLYSHAVSGLSAVADRVKASHEAANNPAVDERRRKIKARLLLAGAAGVGTAVAALEVAKANGVHVPAVSDVFTGGEFGGAVADCVEQKTSQVEQGSVPTPQPGIPVEVYNACVSEVQQAQNSK